MLTYFKPLKNFKILSFFLIFRLLTEKRNIEEQTLETKKKLEAKVRDLEEQLKTAKRQICATICGGEAKKESIEEKIASIESKLVNNKESSKVCYVNSIFFYFCIH